MWFLSLVSFRMFKIVWILFFLLFINYYCLFHPKFRCYTVEKNMLSNHLLVKIEAFLLLLSLSKLITDVLNTFHPSNFLSNIILRYNILQNLQFLKNFLF